jgi:hypothetical protein
VTEESHKSSSNSDSGSEEAKEYRKLFKVPKINRHRNYFQSSLLAIKYINAEIDMNEYVHYRAAIEIPSYLLDNCKDSAEAVEIMQKQIFVKVDLYTTGYDFDNESDSEDLDEFDISNLKRVDSTEIRVNDLYYCKFEYFEVNFNDDNYSQLEGYINCSLMNFRFSTDIDVEKRIDNLEKRKNALYEVIKEKINKDFHNNINMDKEWIESKQRYAEIQNKIDYYRHTIVAEDLTEFFFGEDGPYGVCK